MRDAKLANQFGPRRILPAFRFNARPPSISHVLSLSLSFSSLSLLSLSLSLSVRLRSLPVTLVSVQAVTISSATTSRETMTTKTTMTTSRSRARTRTLDLERKRRCAFRRIFRSNWDSDREDSPRTSPRRFGFFVRQFWENFHSNFAIFSPRLCICSRAGRSWFSARWPFRDARFPELPGDDLVGTADKVALGPQGRGCLTLGTVDFRECKFGRLGRDARSKVDILIVELSGT